MDKEFLLAEVVALLRQAQLSQPDATAVLDTALATAFEKSADSSAATRNACCPFCKTVFPFAEPTVQRYQRLSCPKCEEPSLVITGTAISKRVNNTSLLLMAKGLFLRFKDSAARERYVEIYGYWFNLELKSKDVFALCVGEKMTSDLYSREGKASMINLTLNTSAVVATVHELPTVLAGVQGLPPPEKPAADQSAWA